MTMPKNHLTEFDKRMADDDKADSINSEGLSLSQLLAQTRQAVNSRFPSPVWVRAEINSLKIKTTRYNQTFYAIELAEIENGRNKAQAQAKIWPRHLDIVDKFEQTAQTRLAEQIQVLVKVKIDLHSIYGLQLDIVDIDPNFTLGMMAAKKRAIRRVLQNEGLFWRNKELEAPTDFTRVMIISPNNAAGLGDFRASAQILEQFGLCRFDYLQATFQSQQAPESIDNALNQAVSISPLPDAVVLIRGGGAASDLNWLNDENLARAICRYPVPVFTGIGHDQDSTILDEIAHSHFSTPSKVIEHIRQHIQNNALEADNNARAIQYTAQRLVAHTSAYLSAYNNQIYNQIVNRIASYDRECRHNRRLIESNSYNLLRYRQQTVTHIRKWILQKLTSLAEYHWASIRANYNTVCQSSIHHVDSAKYRIQQYHLNINHSAQTLLQHHARKHNNLYQSINNRGSQLLQHLQYRIQSKRERIIHFGQSILTHNKHHVYHHYYKVHDLAQYRIHHIDNRIDHLMAFINGCAPQNVLQKGYTLIQQNGRYITSSQQIELDGALTIHFHDGTVKAKPIT